MRKTAVMLAAAAALSACSSFSGDDEAETSAQAQPAAPAEAPKALMRQVETLEFGRLFDGYMLTTIGYAPTVGYYAAELRPRNGGAPAPDGLLEFDFVASPPPAAEVVNAPVTATTIRADRPLDIETLRRVAGVRIFSEAGAVEGRF